MNTTLSPEDGMSRERYYREKFNERKKDPEGAEEAMRYLYPRHHPGIYAYTRYFIDDPRDAEEITDDCFVDTWKSNQRFENELGLLKYLVACAHNKSITHLRKIQKDRNLPLREELHWSLVNVDAPEVDARVQLILSIAKDLPKSLKAVFMETAVEGKKNKDYAQENQLTHAKVNNQKFKAMEWIRARVNPNSKK